MHTSFILKSKGSATVVENSVLQGYVSSFGVGKPFSKIEINYTEGGIANTTIADISYNGVRYLGGGSAAFSFSALAVFDKSVVINSLAILSGSGDSINTANACAFSAEGDLEICVVAYANISVQGVRLSSTPERLFELVFGIKDYSLECFSKAYEKGSRIAVSLERESGRVCLSLNLAEEVASENLLIFCDKAHVLSLDANAVAVGEEIVTASGGLLMPVEYGVEITEIAGSDVTSSDIAVRGLGRSVGGVQCFPVPYNYHAEKVIDDGGKEYFAAITDYGITLISKKDGLKEVGAFAPCFYGDVKDGYLSNGTLYVLKDTLDIIDCESCSVLASYSYSCTASRVFVTADGVIILAGNNGFCAFSGGSSLAELFSVSISNGHYHFDGQSQTLTAVFENGIRQFRFKGTSYYEKNFSATTKSLSANGVCGRWGWAILTFDDSYTAFDLNEKTVSQKSINGAICVRAYQGGNTLAVQKKGEAVIFDITPSNVSEVLSVPCSSSVSVTDSGIVTDEGFYPFVGCDNRFELMSHGNGGEFHVYTKTPYFPAETYVLLFEATL